MKHITTILAYMALGLFSASCTKTIEFDGETKTPKLVINSLFNTEDTFKINLSNSLALVDDGDLNPITDAVVKVYDDNGNLVTTPLHSRKGVFMASEFKPQAATNYKVTVESSGYESVEASDRIPSAVPIINIRTERVEIEAGYNEMRLRIKFQDPKGEENFYMIQATSIYTYKEDSIILNQTYNREWLNTTDPNVAGAGSIDAVYGSMLIFSDRQINGKEYDFVANMDGYHFDQDEARVQLRLYSLSEAAYNYFTSLEQFRRTRDNPFATPVQVFSNVNEGFGIFGGASVDVIEVKE